LLSEAWAENPAALRGLLKRLHLSSADAATAVGVHPRTVRAWLASGSANPSALKLLAILAGFVPWDGWQGWELDNGLLFPPGYRRHGIAPGEFAALVFYRQQVTEQRRVLVEREARIAALEAQVATLEERARRLQVERAQHPRRRRRIS
jgi:transcriptional regulator with XRE-family HTH domain